MAARTFARWSRPGAWERLLAFVQENDIKFGMILPDGIDIRAHLKGAGASRKGDLQERGMIVKRLADLVEAMGPRLA